MAQYTIVVPVAGTRKVSNNYDETEIPYLGQSQRYIMTEEEFRQWLDMFLADKTLGTMFYLERHTR